MAIEEGALGGTLGKVAETRVAGIPVGAAAIGAACAGLTDAVLGLLEGVIPTTMAENTRKGIGNSVASFAWIRWGGGLVGRTTAEVTGLLMAYDAVQNFVDIRGKVKGLLSGIKLGAAMKVSPTSATISPIPPGVARSRVPETVEEFLRMRGGAA